MIKFIAIIGICVSSECKTIKVNQLFDSKMDCIYAVANMYQDKKINFFDCKKYELNN